MKKYSKWLYAVPAAVGVYLIYLQFRKKKQGKPINLDTVVVPPNVPPTTGGGTIPAVYPLKRGSKNDTVEVLQSVLNMALPTPNPVMVSSRTTINKLVVDGDFGPKTEEALKILTGKTQVSSASDFQAVIDIIKTKSASSGTPPVYNPYPSIFSYMSEIDNIISNAKDVVNDALRKANESITTEKAAQVLTTYSSDIQKIINNFLENRGAITQEQLNQLEEQVRLTKLKILEQKSKNTTIKYISYAGVIVILFGTLWYLSKKNNSK